MTEEPKFDTCQIDALAAAETGESLILKPSAELINVEQPVDLKELFHELESLTWSLADECREIDEIISMMQEKRAVKEEEYTPRMKDIQERIKAEILKRAKPFTCMWGEATYRKGYDRVSWDSKALAGYAAAHPEIETFKKVTFVEPVVSIRAVFIGDEQA